MNAKTHEITRLLDDFRHGRRDAFDDLVAILYQDLRRVARKRMRDERAGHTLQTTALVHETYLRLLSEVGSGWENRRHFFAAAARAMRNVLVEHARARMRQKRGGEFERVPLEDAAAVAHAEPERLIHISAALDRLGEVDPKARQLVELKYFAGLTIDETAEALGVSAGTVKRDWQLAQAWLRQELQGGRADA